MYSDFFSNISMETLLDWINSIDFLLVLEILFLLAILHILRKIAKYALVKRIGKVEDYDSQTRLRFFKNAIDFLFFFLGMIILFNVIPLLKSISMGVFAGAGLFVALIGLAGQRAVANIIAGFFIIGFKSFRVGDFIYIGEFSGIVEDINLRHTTIRGLDNRRIIIPNFNIATDTIINSTLHDEKICKFIDIDISHTTDIDRAMQVLRETSEQHNDCLDVRTSKEIEHGKPKVIVRVNNIEDGAVTLRAFVWCKDEITSIILKQELLKSLKQVFDKEGISFYIPIRLVELYPNQKESM
jgi:small-conductance mechanosensitive channel